MPTSVNEEEELPKRYRKKMAKIRKFSAEVDAAAFDAIIEYLNLVRSFYSFTFICF